MTSAPLYPLGIVAPGSMGLNKQNAGSLLAGSWATEARNVYFDSYGRVSARKGWVDSTATAISGTPDIEQLFEYRQKDGDTFIISAANNDIFNGLSAPASVKGALTITANNWKFVNFNDKVYGLQTGHALIEWGGSSNFAATTAASGSVPDGNELLSAFGRLWGTSSDGQTVKWCALLDATNWAGTGTGSVNFTNVWANGSDNIVALAAFNAFLVVFGRRNIIILADGSGSSIGLDPQNIYVVDVIGGAGCIARDSVQNIGGKDLVFLSHTGVLSLNRLIQERSSPIRDLSINNRDYVNTLAAGETVTKIRSTYNPTEGFYLLLFPTLSRFLCFDTRNYLEDGSWKMTEWDNFIPKSLLTLDNSRTTYCGKAGNIYKYEGKQDNGGAFTVKLSTGWLALNPSIENRIKVLKRIESIFYMYGTIPVTWKWYLDFSSTPYTASKTLAYPYSGGEWNVGEYGLAEFGGQYTLVEPEVPARGDGQFIQLEISATVNDGDIAFQQMQVFSKIGRVT